MNQIFKNVFAGFLIATASLLSPMRAEAQSPPEPAVVVSIAGMDKQLALIDHMLTASGFPEFKFIAQSTVKQYTKGINTKKPSGVMLFFNEGKDIPDFLAYIPLSNLDNLLDTVARFVEIDEDGDKTVIALDNGMEVIVKKVGDIAYIATEEAMFENVPDAPETLLEDLPAKYNFAAKVYGRRIPESMRKEWLDTIREGYESQMEMMGQEESIQADLQELNWQQFERVLNDMGTVMVGMAADKNAKNLVFDFEVVAEPNSEMAKRMNETRLKEGSLFKGFLMTDAAMTAHFYSGIAKEDVEQSTKMLDKIPDMIREQLEDEDLDEEDIALLERVVSGFAKILADTLAEGKMDGGAVLVVEDQDLNFAAGFRVAKPKDLENIVKELVPVIEQKMGSQAQVELNSGSYKDVTFHRISVDIPDDQEDVLNILGEQIHLIVGIGEKSAYLALGNNPVDLVKKAMDDAGPSGEQPAFQMNFFLAPIMKLAGRASDGDPMAKKMAKKLADNGGDRVRIVTEYIENGYRGQLEVQDGILAMIKVAADSFSGGGMDDEEWDDEDF